MPTATEAKRAHFDTKLEGLRLTVVPGRYPKKDAFDRIMLDGRDSVAIIFDADGALDLVEETVNETCKACEGEGTLIRDAEMIDCPKCDGEGQRERSACRANGDLIPLGFNEALTFLRNHKLYNTQRGIWEAGQAPDEPEPKIADQLKAITRATAQLDSDAVRDVLAIEAETHNREAVRVNGLEAIEVIEEMKRADTGEAAEGAEPSQTAEAEATK